MNININQLKEQLNIEESYNDDNVILQHQLNVAKEAVERYLGTNALTGYTTTTIPISIEQATIMLAAHFYINRNMVAFAKGEEVPYSFKFLLDPYKDFIIS